VNCRFYIGSTDGEKEGGLEGGRDTGRRRGKGGRGKSVHHDRLFKPIISGPDEKKKNQGKKKYGKKRKGGVAALENRVRSLTSGDIYDLGQDEKESKRRVRTGNVRKREGVENCGSPSFPAFGLGRERGKLRTREEGNKRRGPQYFFNILLAFSSEGGKCWKRKKTRKEGGKGRKGSRH